MEAPIEILTPDEEAKLIHASTNVHTKYNSIFCIARDSLIIRFMLDAGLRLTETAKLQWRDCWALDRPLISIRVRAINAKSDTARDVPMTPELSTCLGDWKSYNMPINTPPPESNLFPGQRPGTNMSPRTIQDMMFALSSLAIRRPVHPHVLRHTFATHMIHRADISVVQALLGHRSITTTQRYLHPTTDSVRNAVLGKKARVPAAPPDPNAPPPE